MWPVMTISEFVNVFFSRPLARILAHARVRAATPSEEVLVASLVCPDEVESKHSLRRELMTTFTHTSPLLTLRHTRLRLWNSAGGLGDGGSTLSSRPSRKLASILKLARASEVCGILESRGGAEEFQEVGVPS